MKSHYVTMCILSLAVAGCNRSSPSAHIAAAPKPNGAKDSAQSLEDMLPAGAIQLSNVDLQQVLTFYQELSIGTVDIADPIKRMDTPICLTNSERMSRSEVLRLFEKALHDQAGIITTPTGSNHVALSLERPR